MIVHCTTVYRILYCFCHFSIDKLFFLSTNSTDDFCPHCVKKVQIISNFIVVYHSTLCGGFDMMFDGPKFHPGSFHSHTIYMMSIVGDIVFALVQICADIYSCRSQRTDQIIGFIWWTAWENESIEGFRKLSQFMP